MAFSAENQNQTKPKGHSVNFLHFVCVFFFFFPSNIFAKAVQTDVHVGELMEDQQKAVSCTSYGRQGSLTYWLVLRLMYRLISSLPSMKASIASACYTMHARALSTAHYMYLQRLISCDLPLVIYSIAFHQKALTVLQKINLSAVWCSTFPKRDVSHCTSVSLPREVTYLLTYSVALLCVFCQEEQGLWHVQLGFYWAASIPANNCELLIR